MLFHDPDIESVPRQRDLEPRGDRPAVPSSPGRASVDRAAGIYERRVKPVFDRLVAAMLLVLVLPVLLLVGCLVLLSLGRPVVLRQERVGLHGSTFVLRKFRTMRRCRRREPSRVLDPPLSGLAASPGTGSDEDRRRTHKHPHDPRLVPVGRFLRKWSLDELPQLYNVVRGDMSLVGPRPEMPGIVDSYEPWQHGRHLVKPGITGLWQVSDRGCDGLLMHQRTDIDMRYVEAVSLRLDLKLLLLTVPAALGLRKGI